LYWSGPSVPILDGAHIATKDLFYKNIIAKHRSLSRVQKVVLGYGVPFAE